MKSLDQVWKNPRVLSEFGEVKKKSELVLNWLIDFNQSLKSLEEF